MDAADRDLLKRIDNRTIETLEISRKVRDEVTEVTATVLAHEHRLQQLEKQRPRMPSGTSERDMTRLARKVAREEVEEITGRHELDAKDRQILELKTELRKRQSTNLRVVNWVLHVVAGVVIAILIWLLTGRMPTH